MSRNGFLPRAFLGLGTLTVSRGLGSVTNEPIVFDEGPLAGLQEGTGRRTKVVVRPREAPAAIVKTKKRG